MATRQPDQRRIELPQWGQIMSGPLKGWRFSFLQVVRMDRDDESRSSYCCIDLRCTPPNWPFPQDVRFDPYADNFVFLPGPRARRLDLLALMDIALDKGYARAAHEDRR